MNPRNDSGSATGLIIGIIVVILLGIGAYFLLSQDEDMLIEDNELSQLQNEDVITDPLNTDDTNATNTDETDTTEEDNLIIVESNLAVGNIDAVLGSTFTEETAVVTDGVSERVYRISSVNQKGGDGVLIYLDDSVETTLAAGEEVMVTGTFVEDLERYTLDTEESSAVNAEQAILLVTDVQVQN